MANGIDSEGGRPDRRRFLSATSTVAMTGGLVAGYGTLGMMAGGFVYSSGETSGSWQFVAPIGRLTIGQSVLYTAPSGMQVVVARQGEGALAGDFIALSSVCPHLGCQVHWEAQNDRFFCPCHNGAFDRQGQATEGPPAKARQQLMRFPLKVEDGLLFIHVPTDSVTAPGSSVAECSPELPQKGVTA